jgi:hypothetical protein
MLRLTDDSVMPDGIVSMVAATDTGPAQEDKIANLIKHFLDGPGHSHQEWLIRQLARVFERYRQPGLAEVLLKA